MATTAKYTHVCDGCWDTRTETTEGEPADWDRVCFTIRQKVIGDKLLCNVCVNAICRNRHVSWFGRFRKLLGFDL